MHSLTKALALTLLTSVCAHAEITTIRILPSVTDTEIKTFDSPHYLHINRDIVVERKAGLATNQHQLLLWLTGTNGKAAGAREFCTLAANCGYHVVSLMYPDEVPATICRNDEDPQAFTAFRQAIIQGGSSKHITIGRSQSIENRLIKLLLYTHERRPKENWGQFLTEKGGLKWGSIAVAGQSQGGGHAALIGIKHQVARVICTGSPKDFSKRLNAPAAWYSDESATPKNRFFAFNHRQDAQGCSVQQQLDNLKALGLTPIGEPVDVCTEKPPYHHARILTASLPAVATNADGIKAAHTSVIANANAARWKEAWTYMLTEPVH